MLIKSLEFFDFKTYPHFGISARERNVLVGPNNIGKSTALDALRIAFDVLRFARRRTPDLKDQEGDGVCPTYMVPPSVIQTDLRYCVHNFDEGPARIHIKIANGSVLKMKIPPDGDVECWLVSDMRVQRSASYLKKAFPLDIVVVPTLSPLEQNEELVTEVTAERNRFGRLASRSFRTFWYRQEESEFEAFADLVELGWPGVRIQKPELERTDGKTIVRMYFRHGGKVREVQWAGFGFQVWMQTMMHLRNAGKDSVLVLDEPDVYLHPDLQHRLLKIVSHRVGQLFIATHSTEIINDVDPGDVLVLRPGARSAKRIKNEDDFSTVYDAIGSSENAQFARLARTRKVLYVEGKDARLLGKIGKLAGGSEFLSDSSVTLMKTDGFANWTRVSTSAWVFKQFFEFEVKVASLFDRDYRTEAEVQEFVDELKGSDVLCFVLPFKEIENLLLVPEAIKKVVSKHARRQLPANWQARVEEIYEASLEGLKDQTSSNIVINSVQQEMKRKPSSNMHSVYTLALEEFRRNWDQPEFRRTKVGGKAAFSGIAKAVQDEFGVNLTETRVVDEMTIADISAAIRNIFQSLENFFRD
ncbi:ATP-dependent nuclease [Rhizobium sp. 862_C5_N1_2]|uniref:ATP-dependent nuclease n=1 Tax=Rhizobium sp. 862_C5_N1_2 TaxID=3276277 RepID=UPI003F288AED